MQSKNGLDCSVAAALTLLVGLPVQDVPHLMLKDHIVFKFKPEQQVFLCGSFKPL